mmetsp:Transcript_28156/g.67023  ORF Transcript_28156/g.67023 Transcript_28156/m.67023 type:complete len:116 (+) Transcript_28156:547-894(+)
MLELGLHPETSEQEARQAMSNAMRLLTKHNLKHADVRPDGSLQHTTALKGAVKVRMRPSPRPYVGMPYVSRSLPIALCLSLSLLLLLGGSTPRPCVCVHSLSLCLLSLPLCCKLR